MAGKIRAALFLPQYAKDPVTGALRGIGMGLVGLEIARTLAARLRVELEVVGYPTPSKVVECLKSSTCDLAFMGIEPSRAADVDFSPPVVLFDYSYLVPAGSTIHTAADADRFGMRIAVVRNHASTLALSALAKHAELVGSDLPDAAFDLLRTRNVDAFAAPREVLLDFATKLPGSRVLEDAYGVNQVGIAIPKGQDERLAYIIAFLKEAKTSGLIHRIIERAGLSGFRVAPPRNARQG